MCGIYGIIGKVDLIKKSISALKSLEYRGYDSSGLAFIDNKSNLQILKSVGEIKNLDNLAQGLNDNTNTLIAHTRWATHGKISNENAHPHYTDNVAIVHNGIITNHKELNKKLNTYKFYGDCDSETIAKLIDFYLQSNAYLDAFTNAVNDLKGSFAILCIFKGIAKKILVAKKDSPIFIAKTENDIVVSSDLIAMPKETKEYIEVNDNEIYEITDKKITLYDFNLNKKEITFHKFNIEENKTSLENYKHFMIKEINDIPKALKDTYDNLANIDNIFSNIDYSMYNEIVFIGCGTAYHSACIGAYLVEKIAKKNARAYIASDFIDYPHKLSKSELYVFISQSGETFDTIDALKKVKNENISTITITNTSYSTLSRISDYVLPIKAGKEVAVASTKVYNATNLALLYFANKIKNSKFDYKNIRINYNEIKRILDSNFESKFAKKLINYKNIFFIGKCEDYLLAKEASLKLKEITYINSSAHPSGELKHGTLALIDENSLVVAYLTNSNYIEKMQSAICEIQTRGGRVLLVTNQLGLDLNADFNFNLYDDSEISTILYSIIPMQKISYYSALLLNNNPDKPRNLAKSVTVA